MEKLDNRFKEIGVVKKEDVTLRAGDQSDYYIDVKKAYGDSALLRQISQELWEQMDDATTCIAAAGHGGLPIATAIALEYQLPLVLIRDKQKEHGTKSTIDGYIPRSGDRISIVDDVFTTGSSLRHVIEVLGDTEAEVIGCYVVVKRGEGELPVPLKYLIDSESLL